MSAGEQNVSQCCAAFYSSHLARVLLGESFHPGGTALTQRLGEMLALSPRSHVLDIASGRGTSAFFLASSFGCRVTGVDLSDQNVHEAAAEAERLGLATRVVFHSGDSERLPFSSSTFDAVLCECAFCTFPGKDRAALEFHRVLKPGGRLGLSDLTRTAEPIPQLAGLLAWIACIGDAQPLYRYAEILRGAGLEIDAVEDHSAALAELVRQIQGRLLWAEVMTGLNKLDLPGVDFSTAKQFARAALDAVRAGKLGYALAMATKPAPSAANGTSEI